MPHEVLIEQTNSNDHEYDLIAWAVSSGDRVAAGDLLAELETSKAVLEVVADRAGVFHRIDENRTVFSPGAVIGFIHDDVEEKVASAPSGEDARRIGKVFTQAAAALIERHRLDARTFQKLDRPVIRQADVEEMIRRKPTAVKSSSRLSGNQQDIARVVERSHLEKPTSFAVLKVDYAPLERELARYRAQNKKFLGLVEVLIKLLGELASNFPVFFCRPEADEKTSEDDAVNVGVTIDVGRGLYLPVLHDVARRSLSDLAQELISHRMRAQEGVFKNEHFRGGQLTVSVNMEKDVLHVIPIIHPEQNAMLSVGGILDVVRLDEELRPVAGKEFHLGVVYDHRWINGRDALRFLDALKERLESSEAIGRTPGLANPQKACASPRTYAEVREISPETLPQALIGEIQGAVQTVTRNARLPSPEGMMDLGSVQIISLLAHLQKRYPALKVGALYECQSVLQLAEHLMSKHPEDVRRHHSTARAESPLARPSVKTRDCASNMMATCGTSRDASPTKPEAIAVIGMSGRFPGARNLRVFWRNLLEMRDCVREVPESRWDARAWLDRWRAVGKPLDMLWGGFLEDVDRFDADFFRIAPIDAELMDPQQRLYLEIAWETLEDAGYSLDRIRDVHEGRVGVFTGAWNTDYGLIDLEQQLQATTPSTWPSLAAISNRVSHSFDFNGPSHVVDAMCASSLVSVHLACNSLRDGECDLALAGGVNLSLHPHKYLMLKERRFLSANGRCRSFGADGDGYAPSEGVGALLLKKLEQAIADGDPIRGVIIGSACNHSGKTSGFTVPNPRLQAMVIEQAITRAGVDPLAVSYIEAHGAGTSLGDPIEFAGLVAAYDKRDDVVDAPPCAIGSVKSNVGHCEAAAGVAGLIKTLLQLEKRVIVGSLHAQTINEHINFEESRFRLQRSHAPWRRPTQELDGRRVEWPRIAGVSSFGAGGVNAHIIVQEFAPEDLPAAPAAPVVIVLSAKTDDRLRAAAQALLDFLLDATGQALDIAAVAYTLQTGREAMPARLGLLAQSPEELIFKLSRFIAGEGETCGVQQGRVEPEATVELSDEADAAIGAGQPERALALWLRGARAPWGRLYGGRPPRRVNLPTYQFRGERFWIPASSSPPEPARSFPATPEDLDRAYEAYLKRIENGALDADGLIRELKAMALPR